GGLVTSGDRCQVAGYGNRKPSFAVLGSDWNRFRSAVCKRVRSISLFSYGSTPDAIGMIGAVTFSSVMSLAPKKCLFFFRTTALLCSHASSTKGPLQTMFAASVQFSPYFSIEPR